MSQGTSGPLAGIWGRSNGMTGPNGISLEDSERLMDIENGRRVGGCICLYHDDNGRHDVNEACAMILRSKFSTLYSRYLLIVDGRRQIR